MPRPAKGAAREGYLAMKERKSGPFFLRWPWNAAACVLLVLVLGIFAVPVILLLLWMGRRNDPHGAAEGYCLSRTRRRLVWLVWALLLLFISVALGAVFFTGLGQDRTCWEAGDYVTLAVSGGGSAAMALFGFYVGYVGVRDTFFPAKSSLAQSIRSQLPYPDETPDVEELFAMVDDDLRENARWFGPVGVGQEWVLGDAANRIDRIRGIFTVDEIHRHHTQTGTRTSRTLELVLIDDRWQRSATSFRSPGDLQAAAEYLALRVPGAARGGSGECSSFWVMDESARESFERDFRQRQNRRASEQARRDSMDGGPQDMIFACGGETTSRVDMSLVEDALRRCLTESGSFTLTPTRPVQDGERLLRALQVAAEDGAVLLTAELVPVPGSSDLGLAQSVDERRAREILEGWLQRRPPDTAEWELRRIYRGCGQESRPRTRQAAPDELALMLASGAAERHTTFTREDIQAAAEGIADGTYQKVRLSLPARFLLIEIEAGDKSDARCTVTAARPDPDKLRFFRAQTSPRQAAAWLPAYASGSFLPGGAEWRDCTRQVEKRG